MTAPFLAVNPSDPRGLPWRRQVAAGGETVNQLLLPPRRAAPGQRRLTTLSVRVARIDENLIQRLAALQAPVLDRTVMPLARAADHSALWVAAATAIAAVGIRHARKAAGQAIAALGVSSLIANRAAKRLGYRRRAAPTLMPAQRRTAPKSLSSFPSGHTASAVAFVVASHAHKALIAPLTGLTAAVALSRVFTGMHYPSDVFAGAALGAGVAMTARYFISRGEVWLRGVVTAPRKPELSRARM